MNSVYGQLINTTRSTYFWRTIFSIFVQVNRIPNSFESTEQYLTSFVYPQLEETKAELCSKMGSISSAPFTKVISIRKQPIKLYYDVMVDEWTNNWGGVDKGLYRIKSGDIILFTEAKPYLMSDLRRLGRNLCMGFVTRMFGNDDVYSNAVVRTSKELELLKEPIHAVCLMNMTTANRIWSALHSGSGRMQTVSSLNEGNAGSEVIFTVYFEQVAT